ncbi:F-box/kelch-repeat protein At3g06240-like [Lotus japonicus]|uniref:F-box/kelch-repeat protein At3g06240-like n=1 Tax=Lotus japonicus TaxID=34305 RepID=UPI002582E930|nr:F-box/kelch-repeat protein At3g06240-like [Lotus japonicus]
MKIATQHLPQELITEILLRLPVKSLIRFKAVCKFWCSLISDTHFARSHFELAPPRLVINTFSDIYTMDLDGSHQSNPIFEAINIDLLPIVVRGSCRGFLLLDCNGSLCLLNPSTHVNKPIPSSSPIYPEGFPHLCGFGYDSSNDDYLVVQVCAEPRPSPLWLAHVKLFSLRANMWKYIEGTNLPHMNLSRSRRSELVFHSGDRIPGLLFNEAIHWLAYDRDKLVNVIIAFDLIEKAFLEIPRPGDLVHDFSFCKLWVHGNFLSLSVVSENNTLEIWVMEKYKVQSSWTKSLVLSLSGSAWHFPICSTKGGNIVMCDISSDKAKLVKYSDKGEQLKHWEYFGFLEFNVPMYTESMLSLPGANE